MTPTQVIPESGRKKRCCGDTAICFSFSEQPLSADRPLHRLWTEAGVNDASHPSVPRERSLISARRSPPCAALPIVVVPQREPRTNGTLTLLVSPPRTTRPPNDTGHEGRDKKGRQGKKTTGHSQPSPRASGPGDPTSSWDWLVECQPGLAQGRLTQNTDRAEFTSVHHRRRKKN
jgi:hypothetical protein